MLYKRKKPKHLSKAAKNGGGYGLPEFDEYGDCVSSSIAFKVG